MGSVLHALGLLEGEMRCWPLYNTNIYIYVYTHAWTIHKSNLSHVRKGMTLGIGKPNADGRWGGAWA